jgi:hypothetical protein
MEDLKVKVTLHAKRRIRERLGVNKKSTVKSAVRALNDGISHNQLTGLLKKYIDKVYLKHRKANNIKIYGDKIYLFSNNTLITVLHLPPKLLKISLKISNKIKNDNVEN